MEHELTYKDDEVEKEEQVLENIATKGKCHDDSLFEKLRALRYGFMRWRCHHSAPLPTNRVGVKLS